MGLGLSLCFEAMMSLLDLPTFLRLFLFFRCLEWKDKKDLFLCFLLVVFNE